MNDAPHRYEGRVLPRQDEEVVDQGLAFDIGTLVNRRRALQIFGIGAASTAVAACGAASTSGTSSSGGSTAASSDAAAATSSGSLTEIPDETAGPYPGDGSNGADVLEQSGVVRSDLTSSFGDSDGGSATGIPMTLELTILDIAGGGGAMTGAAVYVWHCTDSGEYSMYSSGIENENYLRGVQITDDAGVVTFTSIVPGCYSGRWPHIHFEVFPDEASITDQSNAASISQIAIPQATCDEAYATAGYESSVTNMASLSLDTDNVFSDDGGQTQLATVTGDAKSGYTLSITVGVDTNTEPSMGGMGGGAGAPGAAPAA